MKGKTIMQKVTRRFFIGAGASTLVGGCRGFFGADGVTAESKAYAARMLKAAEGKKTEHHAS